MADLTPPQKRFKMTLVIDAHTQADLARELSYIADEGLIDGFPAERISSTGYYFTLTDLGEGRDKETFDEELRQWMKERRDG